MLVENTDNNEEDFERNEEEDEISSPFDPGDINIEIQNLTIQHIIERLEYKEINLFTLFQRRPNLWSEKTQSRLIESILLRMPIPAFYFDGKDDGKWQVVDGLQRVSTINRFIVEKNPDKKLILSGMEYLKEFEDYSYDELPRSLQRRIKSFPITVYVIHKGTPDGVKFNLFKRINTSALVLSSQEIRHALNQGIPADFISELADLKEFKQATGAGLIGSKRMEDRDYVNRFVAFYVIGYRNYMPDMNGFLHKGMIKLKAISRTERSQIKCNFIKSMILAFTIFGDNAFRKIYKNVKRRNPLNKAIFDCISVNFARLSDDAVIALKERKTAFEKKLRKKMTEDEYFVSSISTGTKDSKKVEYRFKEIANLIKETIEE